MAAPEGEGAGPPNVPILDANQGADLAGSNQRGAMLQTAYATRSIVVYAIHEGEIDSISSMNTLSMFFLSIGSFFLAASLSVYVNASFATGELPPTAKIACNIIAPCGIAIAVISFGIAGWAIYRRGSTWKRIKRESKNSTE